MTEECQHDGEVLCQNEFFPYHPCHPALFPVRFFASLRMTEGYRMTEERHVRMSSFPVILSLFRSSCLFSILLPGFPVLLPGFPVLLPGFPVLLPGFPSSCPGFHPPARVSILLPGFPVLLLGFPSSCSVSHPPARFPSSCPGSRPSARVPVLLPGFPVLLPGFPSSCPGSRPSVRFPILLPLFLASCLFLCHSERSEGSAVQSEIFLFCSRGSSSWYSLDALISSYNKPTRRLMVNRNRAKGIRPIRYALTTKP